MDETRSLAKFAVELDFKDLPQEVIYKTKTCLLDNFGAILAAVNEKSIDIFRKTMLEVNGISKGSILLPTGESVSPILAGAIHSAMSQATEIDDFHKPCLLHIGSTCIPPAIAIGMQLGSSGRELITAIVAAYEVGIRIGMAVNPTHHQIWHTTGTVGTFAACIAVGKLLGLDEKKMLNALGSAGTQAAGLNQYMIDGGEMSKPLHAGKAAYNGFLSAILAAQGFTGATKILEGEKGFGLATSKNFNSEKLYFSGKYNILSITQRLYPVNGHIISPVQASLDLLKEYPEISVDEIDQVDVNLYHEAVNFLIPVQLSSPFLARFCLPYCISTAITHRKLDNSFFTEEAIKDKRILKFMKLVKMNEDPKLTEKFPETWSSKVMFKTKNGIKFEEKLKAVKGDPINPFNLNEIANKVRNIDGNNILGKKLINRIIGKYFDIENVKNISKIWE